MRNVRRSNPTRGRERHDSRKNSSRTIVGTRGNGFGIQRRRSPPGFPPASLRPFFGPGSGIVKTTLTIALDRNRPTPRISLPVASILDIFQTDGGRQVRGLKHRQIDTLRLLKAVIWRRKYTPKNGLKIAPNRLQRPVFLHSPNHHMRCTGRLSDAICGASHRFNAANAGYPPVVHNSS
jgi:hypothetical protein